MLYILLSTSLPYITYSIKNSCSIIYVLYSMYILFYAVFLYSCSIFYSLCNIISITHWCSIKMAEINALIRKQQSKLLESLAKKSHFSVPEVEGLISLYRRLATINNDVDRLDRTRFREFLHNAFDMTDDILLDRIFKRFVSFSNNQHLKGYSGVP